jgi:hypothetical protein
VQLVIPAPDDPEIHMDPISIDEDEYDTSSDDMEFDNAPLLAPIVDKKHLGQSGQEPRTLSDSRITSDVTSDVASDASSDNEDIDAPHTTPRERETDPTIDDPTTSSSAIIADPAKKVPEPWSKIDRPTSAPIRFSARLAEKRGHTHTIDDLQPSVHTIYAVDPVDANPYPTNIEDALSRWDHARWRLAYHEELTKMDQYSTWTVVRRPPKDINVVDIKWVLHIKNPGTKEERYIASSPAASL